MNQVDASGLRKRITFSLPVTRPPEAHAISCPKIADLRTQNLAEPCPKIADLRRFEPDACPHIANLRVHQGRK